MRGKFTVECGMTRAADAGDPPPPTRPGEPTESRPDDPPLQFDTATPIDASAASEAGAVTCAVCSQTIHDEYFDVNGQSVCARCHATLSEHAEPLRGWAPFLRALMFGIAAAVLGAILYYAVVAITHLEIGIVAIAIGYMVGYGIRMGTRGRGGRRFQIIAVLLTYWSVGLAYVPLAFKEIAQDRQENAAQTTRQSSSAQPSGQPQAGQPSRDSAEPVSGEARRVSLVLVVAVLLGFSFALPVLAIVGSMPSGLISGAIIAFGMHQAWRMTGAPHLVISGPYRIGTTPP
jgi:hypothetical protein